MKTILQNNKPLLLSLVATVGTVIYLSTSSGPKEAGVQDEPGKIVAKSKVTPDATSKQPARKRPRLPYLTKEQEAEQLKAPEGMEIVKQNPKPISNPAIVKAKETIPLPEASPSELNVDGLEVGDRFEWSPVDGYHISGVVYSHVKKKDGYAFGVRLDEGKGRFTYRKNIARELGRVLFNGKQVAHKIVTTDKGWQVEETTVSKMFCTRKNATYPLRGQGFLKLKRKGKAKAAGNTGQSNPTAAAATSNVAPPFQSKPGAPTVIYCDFDGETVTDPDWTEENNNQPINAVAVTPSELSASDITEVLEIVAEDFRPFNVNVTNVRAIYDATPTDKRMMCISTSTDTAAPFSGGVALLDSFRLDQVCFNFNVDEAKAAGDTISHEVGHTLNLVHDGDSTPPPDEDGVYYKGHNSGAGRWGPIMGGAYEARVVQWSKGEYTDATATEDDLQKIVTHGLQYRNDDYGNTNALAQTLNLGSTLTGVIERNTDTDVFKVTFPAMGRMRIHVLGQAPHPNLDVRIRVYNQSETLLATEAADNINDALKDLDLSAGDYYIHVDGSGNGNSLGTPATGWTKYGSIGQYTVTAFADPPSLAVAIDNFTTISSSGNLPWFGQIAQTHDGVDAAQAGAIAQGQSSVMQITKTTTSVSFRYKVSTPASGRLRFFIDGVEQFVKSGEIAWTLFEKNNLTNAAHVFKWEFTKSLEPTFDNNYEPISPTSSAWVDQVVFAGDTGYPQWANAQGAGQQGTGDADNDGAKDILEYGLLGSPTSGVNESLSWIDPVTNKLHFKRDPLRKDLTYKIEASTDLIQWQGVAASYEGATFTAATGITITEVDDGSGNGTKMIAVDFTGGASGYKFARVVVKKN